MTNKDYEAIAAKMRFNRGRYADSLSIDRKDLIHEIEKDLADVMEQDNPRFDRARFLAACRGEDATDSAGRKVRYSDKRNPCCSPDGPYCG